MSHVTPNLSTRATILRALDMLIDGTNIEKANEILQELENQYLEKYKMFSLDSLFFGSIITATLDSEFQSQKASLIQLRDELTGKQPAWKTYALKYNFAELFSSEMLKAFEQITELVGMIEEPGQRLENWERFDTLHENLYTFLYEILVPKHLTEMLLGLLIHGALELPVWRQSETGETFDAASTDTSAGFSSIWTPATMEDSYLNHTRYLRSLIQKIKGEAILYVDLTIVPNHNMLNIR